MNETSGLGKIQVTGDGGIGVSSNPIMIINIIIILASLSFCGSHS